MGAKLLLSALAISSALYAAEAPVTFNKDVLPVLQKNCQTCHRPGQSAPMSFLTYESARPWAKAMKAAVVSRKMPPWFADAKYGHFGNDRSLAQSDIDLISQWADTGAAQGDPKDAPAPIVWPKDGWEIQPDVIINGPETKIAAHPPKDVIEWIYITVPSGLKKDLWVTSMEIRPSELSVTHHICVLFRTHTDDVVYNEPVWEDRPRDEKGRTAAADSRINGRGIPDSVTGDGNIEGCYVPGQFTQDYRTQGAAKLLKANTDIVFQLHYTPNGKDTVDRPRIGFTVTDKPPARTYVSLGISAPSDAKNFAIPPNAPNWESPPAIAEFQADADLVWMFPHMHVRGKDMTYTLKYPDGRMETVLSVPHYDFNWQLGYDLAKPVHIPKGTQLIVTAHYDNSPNNKFNPDPEATVYYGDMTWEEMMFPFFSVIVDSGTDTHRLIKVIRGKVSNGA